MPAKMRMWSRAWIVGAAWHVPAAYAVDCKPPTTAVEASEEKELEANVKASVLIG